MLTVRRIAVCAGTVWSLSRAGRLANAQVILEPKLVLAVCP